MMYRLLMCHHDLRDRLAYWEADAAVAESVVNEVGSMLHMSRFVYVTFPLSSWHVFRFVHMFVDFRVVLLAAKNRHRIASGFPMLLSKALLPEHVVRLLELYRIVSAARKRNLAFMYK